MLKTIIKYISVCLVSFIGSSATAEISSSEFDNVQSTEIKRLSSSDPDAAIIPGQCDESFKEPKVLSDQ